MSIDRIELRKKYYDGNMVREAVMSVTDDYDTIMRLLKAFSDQPPLTDVTEVVRCKDCIYREGSACDYSAVWVRPNGYCQWGQREEGEDEG